ncbi:MAG: HAD family hydrolase [Verrucomicrobiales bacterium]|nr:HAD family hydrolase [Verrucomicrobiales bacterium]|tara:strand:- start:789 stop:1361 length:573 start_codon:yes stop_codon:yes gene_type:complete
MIRGLIFDCDGTLADTMPLHWKAWQAVCQRHGVRFEEERFYAWGGIGSIQIFQTLKDEQGLDIDPVALSKEKEESFFPFARDVQPIEPVMRIVREHKGQVPMAVATGGKRRNCEAVLGGLGVLAWFDAVVTSEDVENQKPAPDIFLQAAERIGIPPEECRGYEDTDLGIQAVRAAGMDAVDIRNLLGTAT